MTDDLYNATRLMLFKNKTKSELDKDYKKIDLDSNGKITQNGMKKITVNIHSKLQ